MQKHKILEQRDEDCAKRRLDRRPLPSFQRNATNQDGRYEVRPRGNSVSHEDEMMNVASNQMDYEAVTQLYTHSLDLIKLAAGK